MTTDAKRKPLPPAVALRAAAAVRRKAAGQSLAEIGAAMSLSARRVGQLLQQAREHGITGEAK